MFSTFRKLKADTSGASAAEYALIVAVLGGLVVIGATAFGGSLSNSLTAAGTSIETKTTAGIAK